MSQKGVALTGLAASAALTLALAVAAPRAADAFERTCAVAMAFDAEGALRCDFEAAPEPPQKFARGGATEPLANDGRLQGINAFEKAMAREERGAPHDIDARVAAAKLQLRVLKLLLRESRGHGNAFRRQARARAINFALARAIKLDEQILPDYARERAPYHWAELQYFLGDALLKLGEREGGTTRLEQAAAAYAGALTIWTDTPSFWHDMAQRGLDRANAVLAQRRAP